jgi:hypothetical protein
VRLKEVRSKTATWRSARVVGAGSPPRCPEIGTRASAALHHTASTTERLLALLSRPPVDQSRLALALRLCEEGPHVHRRHVDS